MQVGFHFKDSLKVLQLNRCGLTLFTLNFVVNGLFRGVRKNRKDEAPPKKSSNSSKNKAQVYPEIKPKVVHYSKEDLKK